VVKAVGFFILARYKSSFQFSVTTLLFIKFKTKD